MAIYLSPADLKRIRSSVPIPVTPRENKYHSVKSEADGRVFDSHAESLRYQELKLWQRAKRISSLECQVPFPLVVNDVKIGKYLADFVYIDETGQKVIEDVKSPATRTASYRLKKKLVKALYGIDIFEYYA